MTERREERVARLSELRDGELRDETEPFRSVPFSWTKQFGVSLRYVGHASKWGEIITWSDPARRAVVSFYVAQGRVVAAAGVKRDPQLAVIEELMRVGRMPAPDALRGGEIDLKGLFE